MSCIFEDQRLNKCLNLKLKNLRFQLYFKQSENDQSIEPRNYILGFPYPVIRWKKDGHFLDLTSSQRIVILSNGHLKIVELLMEDAGAYQCTATNMAGSRETKPTARVQVLSKCNFFYFHFRYLPKIKKSHNWIESQYQILKLQKYLGSG